MELIERSAEDVAATVLDVLHLPPRSSLASDEVVSALLRRAAGFLCPCPPSTLVGSVRQALEGLVEKDAIADACDRCLDALVAIGDLKEQKVEVEGGYGRNRTLIYLGPPAFVRRRSGDVLIVGVAPDNASILPEGLEAAIEVRGAARRLTVTSEVTVESLQSAGHRQLSHVEWLRIPEPVSAHEHLRSANAELDRQPDSGDIAELVVLDFTRPTTYYRGRWVGPAKLTGRFVARRPQAFGAPLWCFVELSNGAPVKLVDFPPMGSIWRGCDHAWRLQAAIDYEAGKPQTFSLRASTTDPSRVVDFFSPVPAWAERRWSLVGEPVDAERCLFSFRFDAADVDEELQFMTSDLWLRDASEER